MSINFFVWKARTVCPTDIGPTSRPNHTTYSRNNMGQKYGLWVLNEIIKNTYPENSKKIAGAAWELPAKYHSQSSPFPLKLGWIGCAI